MANIHGGDLDYAVRRYGIKKENIRDFSGNINPFGIPLRAREAIINNVDKVSEYPDRQYLSLRKAIAQYVNADIDNVLVGNGGTELISLFIKVSGCRNAIISAPVYSEYEREIRLNGGNVGYYALKEENSFNADINDICGLLTDKTDLLVICNPNNPTGTAIAKQDMQTISEACKEKNIKILIDETYCEFSDETKFSSIPLVKDYENMMVIRGVSKFFASPGLRLGYAVCGNKIITEIDRLRDPWSVNTLAAIAAEQFFTDTEYVTKTKSFINKERERIKAELETWDGIRFYETRANFQLFKLLRDDITSAQAFEKLIVKGLMIRDAKSFMFLDDSFIRFCFLKEEDNNLLLCELKKIFHNM